MVLALCAALFVLFALASCHKTCYINTMNGPREIDCDSVGNQVFDYGPTLPGEDYGW